MKRPPLTRRYGLDVAKIIKDTLLKSPYPVNDVFLFGSCAKDNMNEYSDIDIAVICEPFERSKVKEVVAFYRLLRDVDTRTQIVILHPKDLENRFSTLAQEVQRYGLAA